MQTKMVNPPSLKSGYRFFCIIVLVFLLTLSLFLSCTTPAEGGQAAEGSESMAEKRNAGEEEGTGSSKREGKTESIGIPVDSKVTRMMWDSFPREGSPVFFASATRKFNRDEERREALQHGADQASRYVELLGRAFFLKQKTNTEIGYLQDIQVAFDESLAEKLTEKCTPLEEYRDNRNTYLLLELDSPLPAPDLPVTQEKILKKDSRGIPEWVSSPPRIPGFLVGVGVTQGKYYFTDSVKAADEKALEELLAQVSSRIRALHREHSIDRSGTLQETTSLQTTEARVTGFYILSRWTDGRYFYSLAICNPNDP